MLLNGPVAAGTTATEHTGDGTTTAFTFAGYNGTEDGGYIVSVGGIDQPPSKYSITNTAGGTITFVEAPVSGELISIRALVAGSGGGGSGDATSLQGRDIATTAPTDGQVLTWVDAELKWAPQDSAGGGGNATSLQGVNVSTTAPNNGQGLVYNGTDWAPGDIGNATELQSTPISTDTPSTGNFLKFDGTEWVPGNQNAGGQKWVAGTSYVPGDIVVYQPSSIVKTLFVCVIATSDSEPPGSSTAWVQVDANAISLQGQAISSTAPVTGNLLRFDGTNWAAFDGYAIPNWSSSILYAPGDNVWYNGKIWNCVAPISSQPPGPSTSGSWVETLGINSGTPSNQSTPATWVNVQTSAGQGWIPIYQ
jgi:hypothetical protein